MRQYIRKYMIYVVVALVVLLAVYSLVDRMIIDTISIEYGDHTLDIHPLDTSNEAPFANVVDQLGPIPYVPLGDHLNIDFRDLEVIEFEVKDYVLNEDGDFVYDGRDIAGVEIKGVRGAYYLEIQRNKTVNLLTSASQTHYRGIEIIVVEAQQTTSYLLVIETDNK